MKTAVCRENGCRAPILFLNSPRSGKSVPVDAESLNEEDAEALCRGESVDFDKARGHISHFSTCKNPNRFSRGGR